jgi:hypothetical protein
LTHPHALIRSLPVSLPRPARPLKRPVPHSHTRQRLPRATWWPKHVCRPPRRLRCWKPTIERDTPPPPEAPQTERVTPKRCRAPRPVQRTALLRPVTLSIPPNHSIQECAPAHVSEVGAPCDWGPQVGCRKGEAQGRGARARRKGAEFEGGRVWGLPAPTLCGWQWQALDLQEARGSYPRRCSPAGSRGVAAGRRPNRTRQP